MSTLLYAYSVIYQWQLCHTDSLTAHSFSIPVNTSLDAVTQLISDGIKQSGFIFLDNSSFDDVHSFSGISSKISDCYFGDTMNITYDYQLGTVPGRKQMASLVYTVGTESADFHLYGHSEVSYLIDAVPYLLFSCPKPAKKGAGGQTTVYSINELVSKLNATNIGQDLLRKIDQFGVKYIRNDVSDSNEKYASLWQCVSYPTWQKRFNTTKKQDVIDLFNEKYNEYNMELRWDENDTFIQSYTLSGYRKHPLNGAKVWFNQIQTWDARYLDQAVKCPEIQKIPYNKRPFHAVIGNGEKLTSEQYQFLLKVYEEIEISIPWKRLNNMIKIHI